MIARPAPSCTTKVAADLAPSVTTSWFSSTTWPACKNHASICSRVSPNGAESSHVCTSRRPDRTLSATSPNWSPTTTATAHSEPTTTTRRSEEHTSELQSRGHLVCRLLLEKKNTK